MDVSSPANLAEALKAAANVMAAIEKMKTDFAKVDPAKVVFANGKQTTVGEQLALLENVQFVISDRPFYYGGPGAATYNESGGPHRVEFDFEAFDGDGARDYAHPNFSNMEGLVRIIGHELGHVTAEGDAFFEASQHFHAQENIRDRTTVSFQNGDYWGNSEAWANSYSRDLAIGVGLDIDTWQPEQSFDWVSPGEIFFSDGSASLAGPLDAEPTLPSDVSLSGFATHPDYLLN